MYIPETLLRIPTWCLADPKTKYPFSAIDSEGIKHDHTDKLITAYQYSPKQIEAIQNGSLRAGFVLKRELGITVIDIDGKHYEKNPERFNRLIESFGTYTERSQSGTGFHVWCRGVLLDSGRRFNELEMYCDKRYIMLTGDSVGNLYLEDRQSLLDELIATAPKSSAVVDFQLLEVPPNTTDEIVLQNARKASNGDKFTFLYDQYQQGDFVKLSRPSQSECDDALIEMLCFYSPSNEQVIRLFKGSKLYRPHLHNKGNDYIKRSLLRSRNRQELDKQRTEELLQMITTSKVKVKAPKQYVIPELTCPPGFVGYLATEMLARSQNVVPCAAYVSALAMVTGLVSGAFLTPTDAGLNGYYVVMSLSGVGKDAIFTTTHDIMEQIQNNVTLSGILKAKLTDYLDFSVYGSARALYKNLSHNNRLGFTHYNREFGEDFTELCTMRYDAPQVKEARRLFTSLFTIGRIGDVVYSDKENNVEGNEQGCAYTTIGDAIASNVFDFLNEKALRSGLLSRFTFVEFEGESVTNENRSFAPYPMPLLEHLVNLLNHTIISRVPSAHNFNPARVRVAMDEGAYALQARFKQLQLEQIKGVEQEAYRQKWIRQHEKALRVASVLAIADNHTLPVIRECHMQWAIDLMMHSLNVFEKREEVGEVGDVENEWDSATKRLYDLCAEIVRDGKQYKDKKVEKLAGFGVISHSYLSARSSSIAVFRKAKNANLIRKHAIDELIKCGNLQIIQLNVVSGFESERGTFYKFVAD